MEKIVIFDIGNPNIKNNQIFDRDFAYKISHTILPLCHLYEEAKKINITFITPDIFLNNPQSFKEKKVLLISHLFNKNTTEIINLGAEPFIITCQESPFIATRFYINLKKYTETFKYSLLFPGMKKRVSSETNFIPTPFPIFYLNEPKVKTPFKEKKFLTYIGSNKEFKNIFLNMLKVAIIKFLYDLNVKMIYTFRKKIIRALSERKDFDLYGRGWGSEKEDCITKVYKGEVDDKLKKLQEYKYVLCLENAIFPSYITEKIFDCFFAGAVPVYLGASDIYDYIPKNTFINISDFKDIKALINFIENIDEESYNVYIKNIEDFLSSESYKKFSHENFTKQVLTLIQAS